MAGESAGRRDGREVIVTLLPGCPVCRALPAIEAELFADVLGSSAPAGDAPPPRCPVCADLEASARHRFYLLLDTFGRSAVEHAPPGWRPCLPHLRGLRQLRLERWLERWARDREQRTLAEATAAARRYVRTRQQRYRHEATGNETQHLLDAIAAVLGLDAYDPGGDTDMSRR